MKNIYMYYYMDGKKRYELLGKQPNMILEQYNKDLSVDDALELIKKTLGGAVGIITKVQENKEEFEEFKKFDSSQNKLPFE